MKGGGTTREENEGKRKEIGEISSGSTWTPKIPGVKVFIRNIQVL